MTESQGWQLIGIAWLAMAAFDKPTDLGTLIYAGMALRGFFKAAGGN